MFDGEDMLICWPERESGESFLGFLSRLADENGFPTIHQFIKSYGLRVSRDRQSPQLMDYRINRVPELIRLLRNSGEQLFPSLRWLTKGSYSNGEVLYRGAKWPATLFRKDLRAWCPTCLSDGSVDREIWHFVTLTTCSRHGTLLVEECPVCLQKPSWKTGSWRHCACGADLRIYSPTPLKDDKLGINEDILHDPEKLANLHMLILLFSDSVCLEFYSRRLKLLNCAEIAKATLLGRQAFLKYLDVSDGYAKGIEYRTCRAAALGPRYAVAPLLLGLRTKQCHDLTSWSYARTYLLQRKGWTIDIRVPLAADFPALTRLEVGIILNVETRVANYLWSGPASMDTDLRWIMPTQELCSFKTAGHILAPHVLVAKPNALQYGVSFFGYIEPPVSSLGCISSHLFWMKSTLNT